MKLGAYHYVNKPFNLDEVEMLVEKGARDQPAASRGARAANQSGTRVRLRRHHRRLAGDAIDQSAPREGRGEPGVDSPADR